MDLTKHFPLPLLGKYIGKGQWELIAPFEYHRDNGEIIRVPIEFVSDGASIPRVVWTVVGSPWGGRYAEPSVIHDFLCYTMERPRKESDKIFLEAMRDKKVAYLKRMSMYWAVRIWSYF